MTEKIQEIARKTFLLGLLTGIIAMLGMTIVIAKNGWFK